jgi:hypothetical protein
MRSGADGAKTSSRSLPRLAAFRRYVEDEWLPHHVTEPSTREGYTYNIYAHAVDWSATLIFRDAESAP